MEAYDNGNKNLLELDSQSFVRVRRHLDISTTPSHGWRALAARLDDEYKLTPEEISGIESKDSPTENLFKKLGSLGMTIDEFKSCAKKTGDVILMDIFNVHIPADIVDHPVPEIIGVEGGQLTLSVQVSGFPAPQCRWTKDGSWIRGASRPYLDLDDLQMQDAGDYRCAIIQGTDISQVKFSNPCSVIVKPAPDVEIKQHPLNTPVTLGGNALLSCEIWGPTHIDFQWFKGETPLVDSSRIRGCNTNKLSLFNIDESMLGCYYCRISWGKKYVETKGAAVQMSELLTYSSQDYTATDKVALLIGCADYRSDSMLKAPNNDVHTLANIFRSLNFKVVSLLNLTMKEIIAAVHDFSKLVGQGVYCVFYFCGHGFEVSGQLYLVPCDAPHGYTNVHSVSSDRIRNMILAKEPQLFCMILDVCRKPKENLLAVMDDREPVTSANTIVIYGTSYGLKAYEDKTHGLLVNHLKNFLSLPIPIETVFAEFRKSIRNEPKLIKSEKKQIPYVGTNLSDIGRSFADPIKYKGFTEEYNERQRMWEYAHRCPAPRVIEVPCPGFTVKIRLDFEQEFSNKLNIYTTVIDPGLAEVCSAWICGIPNSVWEKAKSNIAKKEKDSYCFRSYLQLPDIHRLKSNLVIRMLVTCKKPDYRTEFMEDLGLPLISVLQLWEDRPDFTRARQPEEVDDSSLDETLSTKTQSLLL